MDLKQLLLKKKRFFDEEVQQYKGSDPLKIRCEFFSWLEKYSKEDIADIYFPLLEETLKIFMEDPTYKQDLRFVQMWLNYSVTQPNPADVIKNIHSRGLGTECAILYSKWAEQLIKIGSFSNADSVFRMGLNGNIQPKAELQKQYDEFLMDIGRRVLMGKIQCPKCGTSFQTGVLSGTSENPSSSFETVEIWEWNPLKVGDEDDFQCPIAYFEDPDPTKIRMYPKDKVYPGNGQEFSLEELLAVVYELRYREEEKLAALAKAKEEEEAKRLLEEQEQLRKREAEKLTSLKSMNPPVPSSLPMITPKMLNLSKRARDSPGVAVVASKRAPGVILNSEWPQDMDNSLANSTTFTVHTKEAMNVVQDMWSSPVPSQFAPGRFQNDNPPESNQPPVTAPNPAPFEIYTEEEPVATVPPPQKAPFQIYDENVNSVPRKSARSAQKPKLFDMDANENAPPGQEIILTSKQASALKPKTPIEIYNDSQAFKVPEESVKRPENQPKPRLQLFKDDGAAELAEKLESQARIQPPMFNVQDKNDDFSDITCNTKAFEFMLPSSTPLAVHKIHKPLTGIHPSEDMHKVQEPTNLSVILEQSKDRSGNSSAGSQASHTTKSSRSVPLLQSDAKSTDEDLFSNTAIPFVPKFRPSSMYSFGFLNTISEEDTMLLSDLSSNSPSKLISTDQNKHKCSNRTYSIDVTFNQSEKDILNNIPPKSSLRKPKSKIGSTVLSKFSVEKENIVPGMLGFPSSDLNEQVNLNVPLRRSFRNKPLASLQDQENIAHTHGIPQASVKPYNNECDALNKSASFIERHVVQNSSNQGGKNNVKKLSLHKIPLRDSQVRSSKNLSLGIGTAAEIHFHNDCDYVSNVCQPLSCFAENENSLSHHGTRRNSNQISSEKQSTILPFSTQNNNSFLNKFSNKVNRENMNLEELIDTKDLENETKRPVKVLKKRGRPPKNPNKENCCENDNVNETSSQNSKVREILNKGRRITAKSDSQLLGESDKCVPLDAEVSIKKRGRATLPSKITKSHRVCNTSKENECNSRRTRQTINITSLLKETNSNIHAKKTNGKKSQILCTNKINENFVANDIVVKPAVNPAVSCSDITNLISYSPLEKGKKTIRKKVPTRRKGKHAPSSVPESFDPFSSEVIESLLEKIAFPKSQHLTNYYVQQTNLPTGTKSMKLMDESFSIQGEIGKGAYAKVLKATNSSGNIVALKVEKPACRWEYYIAKEIQSRVHPKFAPAFMDISAAYVFNNGSILETPYAKYGTLITCINTFKGKTGKSLDLGLILHFSLELIDIVEHLHKCKIIHADLKPDNVVLRELPSHNEAAPCLQLIDFGRCLDMSLFPSDTQFHTVFKTEDNKFIEMKENRPWTYQIDLQGLASIFHILLFTEYMKVQKKNDKWQLQKLIPRNVRRELWNPIFESLLNVNPATDLPFNFSPMRESLDEAFHAYLNNYLLQIKIFGNNIGGK